MRRWLLLALWTILMATFGWGAVTRSWTTYNADFACSDVLNGPIEFHLRPDSPDGRHRVSLTLQESRPDVAILFGVQFLQHTGFGWVIDIVQKDDQADFSRGIQHRYNLLRVGVMSISELERAHAIREAAQNFDVRAWLEARGWLAPKLVVCEQFGQIES
jgi:hypothetical protein